MQQESLFQVFEHQKVRLATRTGEPGLTPDQLQALTRFYEKLPCPYYKLIHQGVQFAQYVGVIRVGRLTIEILPKVGKEGNADLWQQVLFDMLRQSGLITLHAPTQANLQYRSNSILDRYIAIFLDEVETLQQQGLLKAYRQVKANLRACKGKLLVHQQIIRNHAHLERFQVAYQTYDYDHRLNQILAKALRLIPHLTAHPKLTGRTRTLLLNFPEQSDLEVNATLFAGITFTRKSAPYQQAINIAEMLLLNHHPDVVKGNNGVVNTIRVNPPPNGLIVFIYSELCGFTTLWLV